MEKYCYRRRCIPFPKTTLYQEIKNIDFNNVYNFLKEMHFISLLPDRVGLFLAKESIKAAF
jgi:hypothetical protein